MWRCFRKIRAFLSILALCAAGPIASAEQVCAAGVAPIDCHFVTVAHHVQICRFAADKARIDASIDDLQGAPPSEKRYVPLGQCIAKARLAIATTYKAALKQIPRNSSGAAAALKKYQAIALTSLDSLSPRLDEASSAYRRRTNQLETELDLQANMVRVELP